MIRYIDGLYASKTQINIVELRKISLVMEEVVKDFFYSEKDYDKINRYNLVTTNLFAKYNLLMYPFPVIHDLYKEISNVFHSAYETHYNTNATEKHFIQCWLNVYRKNEFIDWHDHQPVDANAWHGFLCVDTEPNSYTSYSWPDNPQRHGLIIDIPSRDGTIVIGKCDGDYHKSSKWELEERPRITIAFDIIPAKTLSEMLIQKYDQAKYLNAMKQNTFYVNHWVPI